MSKNCFVIMGFGRKTDFESGRTLDLDRTYRNLIRPAVEGVGLTCIRADEIRHSGAIDLPMYDQLLSSDVVVADISTSNPNAIYELGVRHALRPFTTVVISESDLKYPFDLNHINILKYKHHGDIIDVEEAKRFVDELSSALREILSKEQPDSPVYTFLPHLRPPRAKIASLNNDRSGRAALGPTVAALREKGEQELAGNDFHSAEQTFTRLAALLGKNHPHFTYVTQRRTLATYKSSLPSKLDALIRAKQTLEDLAPEWSNDPETLGLHGAIEKRLFETTEKTQHLDRAIRAYERGFSLRRNSYNGINYSFLLNVRVSLSEDQNERIADFVYARRIRREIVGLCDSELLNLDLSAFKPDADKGRLRIERYWARATRAEALFGLGREQEAEEALAEAMTDVPAPYMAETTSNQIAALRRILQLQPFGSPTV